MIGSLREAHANIAMAWDTSHAALSGDDLATALRQAYPLLAQLHLANVVADRNHEDYGDHHRRLGPPGLLTIEGIAGIFRVLADLRQENTPPPYLSFEVRTRPGEDPWATERHTRETREAAWQLIINDGAPQ